MRSRAVDQDREGSGCRCPRRRSASRLFRWRVLRRRIPCGFIRWRFVQTQTTQDVIAVCVSAQRGQGIQAAQQSRGRCGAFQVLNRRQGFFKTLNAAFKVCSTRKVRILERYLSVHLGLSGWAATGNVYPGRAHAVSRSVRIARAETQRRHQSVNVTGAGSGVLTGVPHAGADGEDAGDQRRSDRSQRQLARPVALAASIHPPLPHDRPLPRCSTGEYGTVDGRGSVNNIKSSITARCPVCAGATSSPRRRPAPAAP